MTNPIPSIEAHNLVKRYGDKVAVNDAGFQVHGGEFLGFLEPNGAGVIVQPLCHEF